ncbi:unnamed protein product [Gadus morhua 'NCC']
MSSKKCKVIDTFEMTAIWDGTSRGMRKLEVIGAFCKDVKQSLTMLKALPDMFPSPVVPPKRLGHASEAMLHVLESTEDPSTFPQARPLSSPVVVVCETNCILAIGTMAVLIFAKEDIYD